MEVAMVRVKRPNCPDTFINKEVFATSLKILVMHHYLFEPPEKKSDYFMTIQHRDIVFRNVALSDFDVLLCGHKHVPAFDLHDYGKHFDRRAVDRYMLNYFRRLIGLDSLPIQLVDEKGRRFSKALTQLVNVIGTWVKRFNDRKQSSEQKIENDDISEGVFKLLRQGLEFPDDLRRNVEQFLHDIGGSGSSSLEPDELKRIQKRISTGLTMQDRKSLKGVADKISMISRRLKKRAFLQLMSGSSAKVPSSTEARRSFHTYVISHTGNGWRIESQRHEWNGSAFAADSEARSHTFPVKV